MGTPETIRILGLTTILLTYKRILNISRLFLVIKIIFTLLEPEMNTKQNFQAAFQS